MNALVLSGGANKGCYEAGAIEIILKNGFVPDGIYGVSVGSLNALFLADRAGQALLAGRAPDWPQIGSDLVTFWQKNVTGPGSFITQHNYLVVAWAAIWGKFNGLLDTSPLRKLIESNFKIANVDAWRSKNPQRFFSMGVTNVWSALYSDIEESTPNLFDYAMGSAAIPVYMPPAIINGEPIFDGGLRNIAPFKKPIADGATSIVAVVCQPHDIARNEIKVGNPLAVIERSIDILTSQIINDDIDMAQKINDSLALAPHPHPVGHILEGKRPIDVKVVRPDAELPIQLTSFGPADVQKLIDLGRADAAKPV